MPIPIPAPRRHFRGESQLSQAGVDLPELVYRGYLEPCVNDSRFDRKRRGYYRYLVLVLLIGFSIVWTSLEPPANEALSLHGKQSRLESWPGGIQTDIRTENALQRRNHDVGTIYRSAPVMQCRQVRFANDQCYHVKQYCTDEDGAGLLSYLSFYYCQLPHAKPFALIVLLVWLGLLFSTIGLAASDFLCINLSTISAILGMSESVAGITFLAFGNGSPDVFSTFAAMKSGSGSLAVGELIGAAAFITTIVAGSMAIVRPFNVAKRSFVRDISFFIVAASFSMIFLADGSLQLWECMGMVAFYIFYVCFVIFGHWHGKRKRQGKFDAGADGSASRGASIDPLDNITGSPTSPSQERHGDFIDSPYYDNEDAENLSGQHHEARSSYSSSAIGRETPDLERGIRNQLSNENETDDESHAANLSSLRQNMRITRHAGRSRSNTYNAAIRPSLAGALEFRSALSKIPKSQQRSQHLFMPLDMQSRSHSDDTIRTACQRRYRSQTPPIGTTRPGLQSSLPSSGNQHARAASTNDIPISKRNAPQQTQGQSLRHEARASEEALGLDEPGVSSHVAAVALNTEVQYGSDQRSKRIQSHPHPSHEPSYASSSRGTNQLNQLQGLADGSSEVIADEQTSARPPESIQWRDSVRSKLSVSWWPASVFPPASLIVSTLLPTLNTWKSKNIWDRLFALSSAPSIFLLTITVPVAEMALGNRLESPEEAVTNALDPHSPSDQDLGNLQQTQISGDRATLQQNPPSLDPDKAQEPGSPSNIPAIQITNMDEGIDSHPETSKNQKAAPASPHDQTSRPSNQASWNRWLFALQLIITPWLFTLLYAADLDHGEAHGVLQHSFYSFCGSSVAVAFLFLLTTSDRPPRYPVIFCILGFIVAIAWIIQIASEVIGVLKALGVILNISDAILGLTVFAMGNSLGDLVSNITVARLGFPIMALSACLGGPMLNILLGIGLGGSYVTIHAAERREHRHPDRPYKYKPYRVEISPTLFIAGATLLITLVGLLIVVPMRGWRMDRLIGWGLVFLWVLSTLGNIAIEFYPSSR